MEAMRELFMNSHKRRDLSKSLISNHKACLASLVLLGGSLCACTAHLGDKESSEHKRGSNQPGGLLGDQPNVDLARGAQPQLYLLTQVELQNSVDVLIDAGNRPPEALTTADKDEIRRLQRELKRVTEEPVALTN